jgi:hypothetical protein
MVLIIKKDNVKKNKKRKLGLLRKLQDHMLSGPKDTPSIPSTHGNDDNGQTTILYGQPIGCATRPSRSCRNNNGIDNTKGKKEENDSDSNETAEANSNTLTMRKRKQVVKGGSRNNYTTVTPANKKKEEIISSSKQDKIAQKNLSKKNLKKVRTSSPRQATTKTPPSLNVEFEVGDKVVAKEFGKLFLSTIVAKHAREDTYTISYVHYPGEYSDNVRAKKLKPYSIEAHGSIISKPTEAKRKKMEQRYEKIRKKELLEKKVKEEESSMNEGKSSLNKQREMPKNKTEGKIKSKIKKERQNIIVLQPELPKQHATTPDEGKQVPKKEKNQITVNAAGESKNVTRISLIKIPLPSKPQLQISKEPLESLFSCKNVMQIIFSDFDKLWKRDEGKEHSTAFWPVALYHTIVPWLHNSNCTVYEIIKFRHTLNLLSQKGLMPQLKLQCLLFVRFLTTKQRRLAFEIYNSIVDFYKMFPISKNKNSFCPNVLVFQLLLHGCKSKDRFEVKKSKMLIKLLSEQIELEIHPNNECNSNGQKEMYKIGDYVDVQSRMKPGENLPGGRARITNVHIGKNVVDVSYVLESRHENNIHYQFLKLSNISKRPSRFAKLKAKENIVNGNRSKIDQKKKQFVSQYVSILDTWFGKDATTAYFQTVITLMLELWSEKEPNNTGGISIGNENGIETSILIIQMLNMFIEKYSHTVQIVKQKKLALLPGAKTIGRKSFDVGLVIGDGNLFQRQYKGW